MQWRRGILPCTIKTILATCLLNQWSMSQWDCNSVISSSSLCHENVMFQLGIAPPALVLKWRLSVEHHNSIDHLQYVWETSLCCNNWLRLWGCYCTIIGKADQLDIPSMLNYFLIVPHFSSLLGISTAISFCVDYTCFPFFCLTLIQPLHLSL